MDIWRDRVEQIETGLRELIISVFTNNEEDISWNYIPEYIQNKIKSRMKKYLLDNPGEDKKFFSSNLKHKLKFFDVSDYRTLIVDENNWPYFESIFGEQDSLNQRFQQFQKLRNTIAHNRELTDIVVKDGEASILWFSSALNAY